MSAVSLATSVPVMPIAIPMSARLMAGASLTPSPVIATTSSLACSASTIRIWSAGDHPHPVLRRHAGKDIRVFDDFLKFLVAGFVKLGAGHDALAGAKKVNCF